MAAVVDLAAEETQAEVDLAVSAVVGSAVAELEEAGRVSSRWVWGIFASHPFAKSANGWGTRISPLAPGVGSW